MMAPGISMTSSKDAVQDLQGVDHLKEVSE